MKKLLAFLFCSLFLFTFASAEELFTDEMAVQFQNASVGDLASDFVFGMLGLPMEEIAKSSDESKLENLCIVFDRIADISEYAEEYFAFELKKANEEAAAPFVAKEVNVAALDLSKLSFQELTDLKDRINLAIWNSQEWQEVTVPQGVWKVGEDIPAGHWTIKAVGNFTSIEIGTALNEANKSIDIWNTDSYFVEHVYNQSYFAFDENQHKTEIDFNLKNGMYVVIDNGTSVFSPYSGKPRLGFK